ncbi:hypothetical protein Gohar_003329, partial [Gossypium harknessii]|nr:hypothetical protein [Gossypium harknessii]
MGKGTKRAVLVGCNYPQTQFSLHGCINDVKTITDVILNFGFKVSAVNVLIDVPGSPVLPTGANILRLNIKTRSDADQNHDKESPLCSSSPLKKSLVLCSSSPPP